MCPEMGQCPARVRAGEMVPVPCFRPGGHEDSWADAVPGRTPVLFWNGPVGLALAPEGHVKAKAWGGSGLGKSSRGTVRQRRLSWPPQLPCVPSSSCGLRPLPGLCSARPVGPTCQQVPVAVQLETSGPIRLGCWRWQPLTGCQISSP